MKLTETTENAQALAGESRQIPATVAVALPAYNEAANLPSLLASISAQLEGQRFPYLVVVVDDGSHDATPEILQDWSQRIPLRYYRHERNLGLGPTIRDCLWHTCALLSESDVVVTMDADQTHNPGLIPRMLQRINEGHDLVIASRYRPGARVCGLAWHRKVISWMASVLFRCLFPMAGVRDYTCGFRAYRVSTLKRAFEDYGDSFVDQQGFQCIADILLKLRRHRPIATELPFILRYDLKEGQSKMQLRRTSVSTLNLIWKRRTGR